MGLVRPYGVHKTTRIWKANVRDFASKILHTVLTKYSETWQGPLKNPVLAPLEN